MKQKENDMSEKTLAVRTALQTGASYAERQLALIGKEQGDHELALVVADLTPAEINVIVAESDMTKPSLVNAFVTAEQFVGAFLRLGNRWGKIVEGKFSESGIRCEIEDFIVTMILCSDDENRRQEMLLALVKTKLGLDALIFLALPYSGLLLEKDLRAMEKNTSQEVIALLEHVDDFSFQKLKKQLADIRTEDLVEGNEEEESSRFRSCFVVGFLEDLYLTASRFVEKDPTEDQAKSSFVGI